MDKSIQNALNHIRDRKISSGEVTGRLVIKDSKPIDQIKVKDNYYLVVLKINNNQLGNDLNEVLTNLLFRSVKISDSPEDVRAFLEKALTLKSFQELDDMCKKQPKFNNQRRLLEIWVEQTLDNPDELTADMRKDTYLIAKHICSIIINNSHVFEMFQAHCIDNYNTAKIVDIIQAVRNPGTQIETRHKEKEESALFSKEKTLPIGLNRYTKAGRYH